MSDDPTIPRGGDPPFGPPTHTVVVRAAVAPMHAEARVSSPQLSQVLAGHVLLVHEEAGDWLRASGMDAYAAWVHRGYVSVPAAAGDDPSVDARVGPLHTPWAPSGTVALQHAEHRRVGSLSLGCTVRAADGGGRALPLGAWVQDASPHAGTVPHETVQGGDAVPLAGCAARFPRAGEAIAASARQLFRGTSYLWGGVTPWGADCSGFVQAVFRLHGVQLPRDAWQQALEGEEAAERTSDLGSGELLFFSDRDDRRVTHVGIALGGSRMAHVALGRGGFNVEQLDDTRDPYVARLMRQRQGARRVLA